MFNKKLYLITGGAGFIGSHLIDYLINSGHRVLCIDDLSTGSKKNLTNNKSITLLINQLHNIDNIDQEIDGIFHLAAQTSVPLSIDNLYDSSKNNLLGMLKIWEIAKNINVPIVYASSSAIYGNLPLGNDEKNNYDIISPYAQDKLTMEDYSAMCYRVYNTSSIGLRFFNVYGPRQDPHNPYSGVISIFIDKLLKNQSVTVNGGYQTRDFVYVEDITRVMIQSMEYLSNEKINISINVGTGIPITINKLLSELATIINVKPIIDLKELPFGDPERSGGIYNKLYEILGIDINQFVKLKDGLEKTVEYIIKEKS